MNPDTSWEDLAAKAVKTADGVVEKSQGVQPSTLYFGSLLVGIICALLHIAEMIRRK